MKPLNEKNVNKELNQLASNAKSLAADTKDVILENAEKAANVIEEIKK